MDVQKEAISVAEMARTVGLSRARFYQLIGSAFPQPLRDAATNRPYYDPPLQEVCVSVRTRNFGINGQPILFYARRPQTAPSSLRRSRPKPAAANEQHSDLTEGLRSLGLLTVSPSQVQTAIKQLYPSGVNDVAQGEVLRTLFLHLRAQG